MNGFGENRIFTNLHTHCLTIFSGRASVPQSYVFLAGYLNRLFYRSLNILLGICRTGSLETRGH